MLSVISSPYIMEIEASAHRWPETTKPWITAHVLLNDGEYSLIQTISAGSAHEFAFGVAFEDNTFLSVTCFTVADGQWTMRRISEVLIGTLGDAAVVVFRDEQGIDFCPDAPELPVSQVGGLALIGAAKGVKPVDRPRPIESFGLRVYRAIQHGKTRRSQPEGPTAATSNS